MGKRTQLQIVFSLLAVVSPLFADTTSCIQAIQAVETKATGHDAATAAAAELATADPDAIVPLLRGM